jgi:hypothetical protein
MTKSPILFLTALCAGFLLACNPKATTSEFQVQVKHSGTSDLTDISIEIPLNKDLISELDLENEVATALVGEETLQVQWMKTTNNTEDKLFLNVDVPAGREITMQIKFETPNDSIQLEKRTHAELWHKTGGKFEDGEYIGGGEFKPFSYLRVPDECTDHSYFIKYEGPGWESDKVGYRLYLDWRNAIDIFGKKKSDIALPGVGLDGYDSYHEMSDWGADILKVGSSLGMGSLGFWDGEKANRVAETDSVICTIVEDGNIYSQVNIDYYGWKINDVSLNLNTSLSITAGSRATKYSIQLSADLPNLCTGIVKHDAAELIKGEHTTGWNYLATWGAQTLFDDNLGMAILYNQDSPVEINEDVFSHVVLLSPVNNKVEYYFLAAWEQETNGVKTKQEFIDYLDEQVNFLNNPVDIRIIVKVEK